MTSFNTVNRKNVADGLKKSNITENISHENSDDNVTITFKK